MLKSLSLALLGLAALVASTSVAEAGPRRGCYGYGSNAVVAAPVVDKTAPAPPTATTEAQVYRSYSYEPQGVVYPSYTRPGRSSGYNRFDAGNKMRGQY